ncbi:MAG: tetratricopeptide repeat protein [Bacteroidetes bacterium]|nr:MAG: tetratricopeptide repeat protein [Bacteroidota bacterium]
MESQTPVERAYFARKSIAAYRRALEINPENLDARTDMAIAYMYDSENPMMAIQETMKVLESDSLHVNANFNRAIMLLQINRVDQAIEQLRKVKRIVGDPDNAVYIQADQLITDTLGKRNG